MHEKKKDLGPRGWYFGALPFEPLSLWHCPWQIKLVSKETCLLHSNNNVSVSFTSRIDFKKISSERQKKMNVEEKITKSLNGAPSALDDPDDSLLHFAPPIFFIFQAKQAIFHPG